MAQARPWPVASILVVAAAAYPSPASSQAPHKELASISGPAIERSIVSEILWDGGTLLIQTVAMDPAGEMSARYYTVPGPRMEVRRLAEARSGAERYWRMKASRIRPTGLGQITNRSDAKMPMSRD